MNTTTEIDVLDMQPAVGSKARRDKPEMKRVGLAFQGGCFLAGAVHTGVMQTLVKKQVFNAWDIRAFSGTSAGGLVAAACWLFAMEGMQDRDEKTKEPKKTMQEAMAGLPAFLESMWLYNALGVIPTQAVGDWAKDVDRAARHNRLYDWWFQNVGTVVMRTFFRNWIRHYLGADRLKRCVQQLYEWYRESEQKVRSDTPQGLGLKDVEKALRKKLTKRTEIPRLVLGSANVLRGEIISFTEFDVARAVDVAYEAAIGQGATEQQAREQAYDMGVERFYEFVEASGSLDDLNGTTNIPDGPFKGKYLDGAWGKDPAVADFLDYAVDEVWIVEIFPKTRPSLPETFAEREDRKEELLQNALLEHELHMIEKVNEWIRSGRFITNYSDYRVYIDCLAKRQSEKSGKNEGELAAVSIEPIPEEQFQPYRKVKTRRMPMTLDFTPGARVVNSPTYLQDKMEYGRCNAEHFLSGLT